MSGDPFLDDLSRRSFLYFLEQTDPQTGLTRDRAPGGDAIASTAATGFALASYCVAVDRDWISPEEARSRVRTTLRFLSTRAPRVHGWFYHYMDARNGSRAWNS